MFGHCLRLVIGVLGFSACVSAQTLDLSEYEIYLGDFNNDGLSQDIYLHGKETFVLLHGDISVPLLIPSAASLVFYELGDGSYQQAQSLLLSRSGLGTSQAVSIESAGLSILDSNGDGIPDSAYSIPPVPQGLGFNSLGNNLFEAEWSAVASASGYQLYKQFNGGVWKEVYSGEFLQYRLGLLEPGNHTIRVRACADISVNESCSLFSTVVSRSISGSAPPSLPQAIDPSNDEMVEPIYYGKLQGDYEVGTDGAFNYSIPIDIPPGINGVQPNLALSYNSSRKNGIVGWGWALDGLSVISRCPASLIRDGYKSSINSGDNYKYCLDGKRLVEVSENEFRTEVESFWKIKKYDSHWTVSTNTGTLKTYGDSDSSRREDDADTPYAWYLVRLEDVAGNAYTVTYEEDTTLNTHRVNEIKYTFNSAGGTDHSIIFEYEDRSDKNGKYTAGTYQYINKRLSRVLVKTGENTNWSYGLNYQVRGGTYFGALYDDPTNTSRLYEATKCFGENSDVCVDPIQFEWPERTLENYVHVINQPGIDNIFNLESELSNFQKGKMAYPDINGDGRFESWPFEYTMIDVANGFKGGEVLHYDGSSHGNGEVSDTVPIIYQSVDVNGDGYDDVVNIIPREIGLETYLSDGSSISEYPDPDYSIGSDQFYLYGTMREDYPGFNIRWTGNHGFRVLLNDVNGDGLLDVIRFPKVFHIDYEILVRSVSWSNTVKPPQSVSVAINTGTGFSGFEDWYDDIRPHLFSLEDYSILSEAYGFHDVDGDGLVDLVLNSDSNYLKNNGNDAFEFSEGLPDASWGKDARGDFNGDGNIDSFRFGYDGDLYVVMGTANGTSDLVLSTTFDGLDPLVLDECIPPITINDDGDSCFHASVDFDNDGLDDIIQVVWDDELHNCSSAGGHASCPSGPPFPEGIFAWVYLSLGANENGLVTFRNPILYKNTDLIQSIWYDGEGEISQGEYPQYTWSMHKGKIEFKDYDYDGMLEDSFFTKSNLKPNHIVGIKNGNYADKISIEYRSFSSDEIYDVETPGFSNIVNRGSQELGANGNFTTTSSIRSELERLTNNFGVKELRVPDGVGGDKVFTYRYYDSRSDRLGYGSLGFSKIEERETILDGGVRLTISEFSQEITDDYNLSGSLLGKQVYVLDESVSPVASILIRDEDYAWKVRTYEGDTDEAMVDAPYGDDDDDDYDHSPHYLPYKLHERQRDYDLATGELIKTTYTSLVEPAGLFSCESVFSTVPVGERTTTVDEHFHDYGVPLYSTTRTCNEHGVVGSSVINSSVIIKEWRNAAPSNRWAVGLIEKPVTKNWVYDSQSGEMDEIVRTTEFLFDDVGRVTTEIREPLGGERQKLTQTYTYNDYGTVDSIKDDVTPFDGDGIDFSSREVSLVETISSDGERTVVTTNPLSQTTTVRYDGLYGLEVYLEDENKLPTIIGLDDLGRKSSILFPDSVTTSFGYRECTACLSYQASTSDSQLIPNTIWYVQEKSSGKAGIRKYHDEFNREIARRTKGLTGEINYSYTEFDGEGNVVVVASPFRDGEVPLLMRVDFDSLDRPTRTVYPDLSEQLITYGVYEGVGSKLVTNTRGHTTRTLFDSADREKEIIDSLGSRVVYDYDGGGNLSGVSVQGRDETVHSYTIHYDELNRKVSLIDPNVGLINYEHNAFGGLVAQTDGDNIRTEYKYDEIDRQVQRVDDVLSANPETRAHTWVYDNKLNGIGLLGTISGFDTDGEQFILENEYDEFSRLESKSLEIKGDEYEINNTYDIYSRIHKLQYPTGFALSYDYGSYGALNVVANANTGQIYWENTSDDAFGNVTNYVYGNGVATSKVYDPNNGLIDSVTASINSISIQQHDYDFDSEGNLVKREDFVFGVVQKFCYDELDRLTANPVGGSAADVSCSDVVNNDYSNSEYAYDAHGNITKKSGISDYEYGDGAGPHAVTFASGSDYDYSSAGRMESGNGRFIQYSPFGKPSYISRGHYSTSISYASDQKRVQRIDVEDGVETITTYFEKLYEKVEEGGYVEHRHYVGDHLVHVLDEAAGTSYNVYKHQDHIGSLVAKTDDVVEGEEHIQWLAYEPWGRRQDESWSGEIFDTLEGLELDAITYGTARGFTDHEHLDGVGLIHMNGRVYDPIIGRFLTPDPWIQDPKNTQSFNRYSYVWNNPLRYTDPTGELIFIPVLIKAATVAIAAYNVYDNAKTVVNTVTVLADKNASTGDKMMALGDAALTVADVTPGNLVKKTGGAAKNALKQADSKAAKTADNAVPKEALNAKTDSTPANANGKSDVATPDAKTDSKCCFVAGTLVQAKNGLISIEEIQLGDLVLAKDSESGDVAYKPVSTLFTKYRLIYDVIYRSSQGIAGRIGTTDDHPFYVVGRGWIEAAKLISGDVVETSSGDVVSIESVTDTGKYETTYNITVDDYHTYYVTERSLLVHNVCDRNSGSSTGGASKDANNAGASEAAKKNGGRGKNHLKPDSKAEGPHSTSRRDGDGNVTHHAEWKPNDKNPSGYDQVKRVDTQYAKPHEHNNIPTPHAHDKTAPSGVRPTKQDELPR